MTAHLGHILLIVAAVVSGAVMLIGVAALNLTLVVVFGVFLLAAVVWDSFSHTRSRQWNEDTDGRPRI